MPNIDAHLFDRIRLLEARVAMLERERDSAPERFAMPGVFGTLAFCKINATALVPGSSAEVSLYRESNAGALEDSGADATAYAPPYFLSGTLGSGKIGIVLRLLKRLWWIGGQCPS